jgi:hypothetical protein
MTESKSTDFSFTNLCHFFEELTANPEEFFKLNAFKIQKMASQKNLNIPAWFNGVVRTVEKLNLKMEKPIMWIGPSDYAEMASHFQMSKARISLIDSFFPKIDLMYFPTNGLGLDAYNILKFFNERIQESTEVIISDIDPTLNNCTEYNFSKSKIKNVSVIHHDLLEPYPFNLEGKFNYCFADPARRTKGLKNKKGEYEPDLSKTLAILQKHDIAQIKLSANENIETLVYEYPDWHWTVLAHSKEVKEIFGTWFLNIENRFEYPVSFIVTEKFKDEISFHQLEGNEMSSYSQEISNYLYLPHPAISCANLADAWISKHSDHLAKVSSFFTSENEAVIPLVDGYKIIALSLLKPKAIKNMLKDYSNIYLELINPDKSIKQDILKACHSFIHRGKKDENRFFLMPFRDGKKHKCFLLKQLSFCDHHYIA